MIRSASPSAAPSPLRLIVRNCAPAAGNSALGLVVALIVTGMIGHMGGSALYVRSVYLPISLLMGAAIVGVTVPLQVAVARGRASAEPVDHGAWIGSAARLAIVLFALLALAVWLGAVVVAKMADLPAALTPELRRFALAMIGANFVGCLGEFSAATLRGSERALLGIGVSLVLAVTTVVLVAVLGLGLGLGLAAIPIASTIAGIVELIIGGLLLGRLDLIRWRALARWSPKMLTVSLQIGLPIVVSYVVLVVDSVVLLHIVGHYGGGTTLQGFSSASAVQDFVTLPALGFGSGLAVLLNGRPTEAPELYGRAFALLVGYYVAMTVVVVVAAHPLADALVARHDVAAHADRYLRIVGPGLGLNGLTIAALTVLEETGSGGWSVSLNLLFLGGVTGIGWWLTAGSGTVDGLYWTMLVASIIGGATVPFLAAWRLSGLSREMALAR